MSDRSATGKKDAKWPIPAVGALIERPDGKIFLAKSPNWNNKWIIPGGKVKEGECLEEALAREVKEETGLEIRPEHMLVVRDCVYPKNYYKKVHFLLIDFLCRVVGGAENIDNKELTASKWVSLQQATEAMDVDEHTLYTLETYARLKGFVKDSVQGAKNVRTV